MGVLDGLVRGRLPVSQGICWSSLTPFVRTSLFYETYSLILLTMHLTLEKILQAVENEKPEIAQELRD